jgi:cell division transport system permease protein
MVLLMAAATSAAVVLAARGALDTHRSTIEIMHGIGATDEQVARLFQRKIALDALAGALVGGAVAALALLLIGAGGTALARDLAGTAPLTLGDLVLLAMLPLAAVVLATLVARAAVLSALRQSP